MQKATIYLSYLKIKNNLDSILQDVNRMPLKHVSKQSDINQKEFFNERNQIYGSIFSITFTLVFLMSEIVISAIIKFPFPSVQFILSPSFFRNTLVMCLLSSDGRINSSFVFSVKNAEFLENFHYFNFFLNS